MKKRGEKTVARNCCRVDHTRTHERRQGRLSAGQYEPAMNRAGVRRKGSFHGAACSCQIERFSSMREMNESAPASERRSWARTWDFFGGEIGVALSANFDFHHSVPPAARPSPPHPMFLPFPSRARRRTIARTDRLRTTPSVY